MTDRFQEENDMIRLESFLTLLAGSAIQLQQRNYVSQNGNRNEIF